MPCFSVVLGVSGSGQRILDLTGVTGGLVVHIGCGDGELTAGLYGGDSYLVHGLDRSGKNVQKARDHIRSLGIHGKVTVDRLAGDSLGYIDNLVNLVVAEDLGGVSMDEVMRVLRPSGIAYIKEGRSWTKRVKPRPESIDEWTHYLYDSGNNAVSGDLVVGPPRHLQWQGSPRWSRHHDHMASVNAMVSSGGRMFYVIDEGSRASVLHPPKWHIVARDAFNGVVLWKRPLVNWHPHLWPLKSGPANLPRRLVAKDNVVYVPMGVDEPLVAIDAATGAKLLEYDGTVGTEELILSDSVLFVLVNELPYHFQDDKYIGEGKYPDSRVSRFPRMDRNWGGVQASSWLESRRAIKAFDSATGRALWQRSGNVVPLTLAADSERTYYYDGEKILALDRADGKVLWSSNEVPTWSAMQSWFAPTLVVYGGKVLFAGGENIKLTYMGYPEGSGEDTMFAFSAKTGKQLWKADHPNGGYNSPEDLLIADSRVWTGSTGDSKSDGILKGHDLGSGRITKELPPTVETKWFHHRCYRAKGTEKYLLMSRTGIEFLDLQTKEWTPNHWVRGGCLYGVMPANGLIYTPPHDCPCYIEAKQYGFNALAPTSESRRTIPKLTDNERLEKGPAYGKISNIKYKISNRDVWPTYRGDSARSGHTATAVPESLRRLWKRRIGGSLTSPVNADGKIFVAERDRHVLHAIDENSGRTAWQYTAGGRIDSPPTIYKGSVLFGCADGYVYCLRSQDGRLAWRFLAAPADRRTVAFEQLESVWPLSGSVLIQDDVLYCVAGRSMFIDGGLRMYRLEPLTGRKLGETVMSDRNPETGSNMQDTISGLNMAVALPDVLSSDGERVYMRSQVFDLDGERVELGPYQAGKYDHLFSPAGFLDDTWFHRNYWLMGCLYSAGPGYSKSGKVTISGKILVHDDEITYGYGREDQYFRWTTQMEFQLFAARHAKDAESGNGKKSKSKNTNPKGYIWQKQVPLRAHGLVLAGRTLFVAGPRDIADEEEIMMVLDSAKAQSTLIKQDKAFRGESGGLLMAVSADDGAELSSIELDTPPRFDGMIAGGGRLYFSGMDGSVQCYGK